MFPRQQEIREFHQEVNEIKPLTLSRLPTPHKNQIGLKTLMAFMVPFLRLLRLICFEWKIVSKEWQLQAVGMFLRVN